MNIVSIISVLKIKLIAAYLQKAKTKKDDYTFFCQSQKSVRSTILQTVSSYICTEGSVPCTHCTVRQEVSTHHNLMKDSGHVSLPLCYHFPHCK